MSELDRRVDIFADEIGFIVLKDKMQLDHPLKITNSARISYSKVKEKFDEKDQKLVGFLWNSNPPHTSPFRHSYYTFHIKIPLFTMRQWLKYQVGCAWRTYEIDGIERSEELFVAAIDNLFDTDKGCSWNELSGRYVELEPEFYIPYQMRTNAGHGNRQASSVPENWDEMFHARMAHAMSLKCESDYSYYQSLLAQGIAKELARGFLPQNIYSEAYWTVSLQGVLHFLNQRLKSDAQYEIRQCAEALYALVEKDLTTAGITKESLQ
jgi:thymidylate synthase (FAD)